MKKNCTYLIFLFLFLSCEEKNKRVERVVYDPIETNEIRSLCFNKSSEIITTQEYWNIYNQANDTLQCWIKNGLRGARPIWESSWEIDSVIFFNTQKNKLRFFILDKCIADDCRLDAIGYYNGVKINQQWYFFDGPAMVLPRKYYQDSINTPLDFEKMKQIATHDIYSNYLIKKKNGGYEIDEDFFRDLTSIAWGPPTNTREQWDSTYLEIIRKNWEKKDD